MIQWSNPMSASIPQVMTVEAIRSVPLFASLHDEAAQEVLTLLQGRDVASGTSLFRAGDKGDAMYLIKSGRVRIAVNDEDGHQIVLVGRARGVSFAKWPSTVVRKRGAAPRVH